MQNEKSRNNILCDTKYGDTHDDENTRITNWNQNDAGYLLQIKTFPFQIC